MLAACVLVFGSRAGEVADASTRRPAPAPRRTAPAPKPVEARETIPATQSLGQVSGESVNIRLGPSMQHSVVGSMRAGEFVKARAKQNGWVEIDWPSNVPAWVEKSDVRLTTRTDSEQMGVITDGATRVYSQGSTKSQSLATLSKGAPVEILGEQGTWYKVKAPPTATAYISAKFVVTGLRSQQATPAKVAAPASIPATVPTSAPAPTARSLAAVQVGNRKQDEPKEVKRAIPMDTPVAPPPIAKAVLPAPTAPAAVSPEEPKSIAKPEGIKTAAAPAPEVKKTVVAVEKTVPTAEELAKAADLHALANTPALEPETEALPPLEALMTTPDLNAILNEYEALPVLEEPAVAQKIDDPASELKEALNALRTPTAAAPVAEAKPETAKPVADVKPSVEAQNDLAKAIEETRQSIKQDEPKRSVIDDNLQALERARLASETRRKEEEDKQRASLSAALKQFEAMETRRRTEPDQAIDLGIDARTGVFLAPPEPAQTENLSKLQNDLQKAFDTDQSKLSLEREKSAWTDAIRRAEEWRTTDIEDTARRDNALLEAEENEHLSRLLTEDAERMQSETQRALDIQRQLETQRTAPVEELQKRAEPMKETPEQEILKALENARKKIENTSRAETIVPDAPEETAKPKMEIPQSAVPVAPISTDEKYGYFVDPSDAPKAKKPVEELRSLMFPTEPASSEPTSSRLPDIGRLPRTETAAPQAAAVEIPAEAAKTVELESPAAQPVTAKPLDFTEPGIDVIAQPDGTIHEDQFRTANKRAKSKYVVPNNSPAPLGKRAEVINLD